MGLPLDKDQTSVNELGSVPDEDHRGAVRRALPSRRTPVVLGVLIGVLVLVLVADRVTASPQVCGSCHEMRPRVAAWAQSAHAEIECVSCHTTPGPWYAYPQRLAARVGLLGKDVYKHVTNRYEDPVDRGAQGVVPMADEVCLQCHDPNRKATSGFRIQIEHAEHAKRNGSCVSCHVNTAHPDPARGIPLTLMAQCFECHGTAAYPEAPTECGVCHPAGYELRPASHKTATWKRDHGESAAEDKGQCTLCHTTEYCTGCHGVEMPHPQGWARGATGHGASAQLNRTICAQCHAEKPDLCSMCHHQAYDPTQGTWVRQHYRQVRDEGAAFCFECHAPAFCVECHAS